MSIQWKGDVPYWVYWDSIEKKQKWKWLKSRTEKEAKQEAAILKGIRLKSLREGKGDPFSARDIPWPELKKEYLALSGGNGNCASTLARKEAHFKHIDEVMGIEMTSEWTILALEKFKQLCRSQGMAPGTINKELGYIKAALRLARRLKCAVPPSEDIAEVKQMVNDAPEAPYFTDADQAKILAVANPLWRVATMLAGLAGLRRGEVLNLRWQDLNFVRKEIHLADRKTWRRKTRTSNTVPMHDDLLLELMKWREANPSATLVVPWGKGENEFSHAFARLVKKAGLQGSFKSLRHGVGTGLMRQDVSSLKIRDILGHASVKTTERYAHVRARDLGGAIDKLPSPLRHLPEPSNKSSNETRFTSQQRPPQTTINIDGGGQS
jgi:integrase